MANVVGDAYIELKAGDAGVFVRDATGKLRKVQPQFAKTGAGAGDAYAEGFSREAHSRLTASAKRAAVRIAGIIGGAYLVRQGTQFLKSSLEEAVESNKITAQSAAVIKSTGGAAKVTAREVARLATQISNKTGVDDESIQAGQNMLLTFTNIRNELGKGNDIFTQSTRTLVDLAAAMGTDPKQAAIQLGKALNDPVKGITALTRVGVTFTDQQKDQIKWLVATGNRMGAQKIILRELNREFGGSAEAQASSLDKIRVTWGNLKETVGNAFLPLLDSIAPRVISFLDSVGTGAGRLAEFFTGLGDELSRGDKSAGLAVEIGKVFGWAEDSSQVATLIDLFEQISDGLGGIRQGYEDTVTWGTRVTDMLRDQQDVLLPIVGGLTTFATTLYGINKASQGLTAVQTGLQAINGLLGSSVLANPYALVIAGIVAVGAALFLAYKKVKPFHDAVDAVGRVIRTVAVAAFHRLVDAGQAVVRFFGRLGGVVGGAVRDVQRRLGAALSLERILPVLRGLGAAVVRGLEPLTNWISEHLVPTLRAAGDFFDALGDRIRQVARYVGRVAQSGFRLLASQMMAVAAVARFLGGIVTDVLGLAFKVVQPIVVGVLRLIGSELRTAAQIVKAVFGTAFDAAKLVVVTAFNAIKAVVETVLGTLQGIFTFFAGILRGDFSKAWSGLVKVVTTPVAAIWKFVRTTFGNLGDFLGSLPGRFLQIGRALFDGMLRNGRIVLETIGRTVHAAFDGIVSFVAGIPARLATLAKGLFASIITAAKAVPGDVAKFLGQIPSKLSDLAGQLLLIGTSLGAKIIGGLLSGLSGAGKKIGQIGKSLFDAVKGLGKDLINGVIQALNDLLPNSIGKITVLGKTIFPGLDLPDNPIPKLARGAIVQPRPGGVLANIAEAGRAEAVLPLPQGVLAGLARIGRDQPVTQGPTVGVHVDQIVLGAGTPLGHALAVLDRIDAERWLQGVAS